MKGETKIQVYREPQPVTGKLSVPLRLIPLKIQTEILEAVNQGQAPLLTITVKNSYSDDGFSVVTDYGQEALLEFDIHSEDIVFE